MAIPTCSLRSGDRTFSIATSAMASLETKLRNVGCFRQSRAGVQVARSSISTVMDFWISSSCTMWTSTSHTRLTLARPANASGKESRSCAVRAGLAYNEDGREQAGMGAAAADFDGDGLLDIFKTNFADDTHTMYKNRGGDNFDDDTIGSGLAVNTKYLGWGTAFLDFDNDGW